jgi:hypothetical protein
VEAGAAWVGTVSQIGAKMAQNLQSAEKENNKKTKHGPSHKAPT